MSYLKLLKLLYIADREALRRWGIPISHDRYVSMDHGPVLSRTYNLIKDGGSKWSRFISVPQDYEVRLLENPGVGKLSPAEESLLEEVFLEHGEKNRWTLVDLVHTFPEWKDPSGSSLPLSLREILLALGEPETEIQAVLQELQHDEWVSTRLGVA
jgi:uncharacterized phage-associated protein